MENSTNSLGNEQWKKIQYSIKRESKVLKFNDINEVEEETTYLIKFDKNEIESKSKYLLETPITYFRIPEKTIQEYQKYLLFKKILKSHNELKKITKKVEDIYQSLEKYKEYEESLDDNELYLKSIQQFEEIKSFVQKVEEDPHFKEDVQKYGLELHQIKDLNTILIETKSEILFEKIIWHLIFEGIFNSSNSDFINTQEFIKTEIENTNRETNLKKIEISENIRKEINEINIREYIEKSGNFENIINYPSSKKKIYLHHNTSIKWLSKLYIMLFPFLSVFFIYLSMILIVQEIIIWIILFIMFSICPIIILNVLKRVTDANKRIMKYGNLKEKFEEKITSFLIKQIDKKKKPEDNIKRKLFLDSLSEILFNEIHKFVFRDLDKCIRDYKSFNPVSIEIYLNGNQVFPIGTSYEDFFHKTSIPINIDSNTYKEEFILKMITKKTLRKNKKKTRKLNSQTYIPQKFLKLFIISTFFIWGVLILHEIFEFLQNLNLILMIILMIIWFLTLNPLIYLRTKYIYYSSLMAYPNKEFLNSKLSIVNLFSSLKSIYSLTIELREDCSYYFLAYAPRFHRIKFAKEMKEILRGLYTKLPTDLSSDIISFNIPRRKKLNRELEFDIDLEIPISGRIWCWIIGIFIMLILMIISGIMYIISILNPLFFVNSFDLSTLRFVLTFLTLLIGFFGKDLLSEPTKDLHKIGIILIFTSLIVGIIFVAPIFITLFY